MHLFKKVELDVNNKHCFICKRDYNSKLSYQNHMNKVHKNGKKEPVNGEWRVDPFVQPDPKDPNCFVVLVSSLIHVKAVIELI